MYERPERMQIQEIGGIIMQIIKTVQIKQVITELSKAKLFEKFQTEKDRLQLECDQLQFEQLKMKKQHLQKTQEIDTRFHEEILEREEKMDMLDFKLDQLDQLEIGSEIIEGEVHSLQDIRVGDDWNDILEEQSIIIKDDVVIKINE